MSATPPMAEWTTTTTTPPTAPRRTTAAGPATTLCFATGGGGACGSRSGIQPPHRWRDLEHATTIRTSAAQPARQAPLNPGLSRWLLPLVPHRTRHRFATTNASSETNAHQNHQRPRSRFVRARLRCSSRASLPLTPQAGTPTATIGMRPATSLRTKAKSVNRLLRAVGRRGFSYASSAARVPTALKMLSQEKV